MIELLPALLSLTGGAALLSVIAIHEAKVAQAARRDQLTYELRFPKATEQSNAETALAVLASLETGREIGLSVEATGDGFRHLLHVPREVAESVAHQLAAAVPGLRLLPLVDRRSSAVLPTVALRVAVPLRALLKDDDPAASSQVLLAGLAGLKPDERVVIRWALRPAIAPSLPDTQPQSLQAKAELGLRKRRIGQPGFAAAGLVLIFAADQKRVGELVAHITAVFRSRRSVSGLVVRKGRVKTAQARPQAARVRSWISTSETLGLIGWPLGTPRISGLVLGSSPILMPSPRIPTTGRVLATSTWPGTDRPLAQPVIGALSHSLLCGPTGVGKSSLMANLALQDIGAGHGALVLDGQGDMARDIAARLPRHRLDDVIVLDPGRGGPVPGLRVFGDHSDPQLAADVVLNIFGELYADSFGPWSRRWLRAGLVTLAGDPEATIADLPALFSQDGFRRRLVARLKDPILEGIWASFEAMAPEQRAQQLASPLGKVEEVIGRPVVRSVLAQSRPSLDMNEVLATGKIVLVALSPGQIGTPAARLLGALVIFTLFQAVQARAAIPAAERDPFFAYIDEPKVLGALPVPLDATFELARGLGVGIALGCQSLQQLSPSIRSAAVTNAATIVAFRQAAEDARLLARELDGVTPDDLQQLGAFEIVTRIGLGPGDVAPPASGRTYPPLKATIDPELVYRRSAELYGTGPAEVDAGLRQRHQLGDAELPIGRVRREI